MKQYFFILKVSKSQRLLLFFYGQNSKLYSQYNLVPNSSFENNVICPNASYDRLPNPWYTPTITSYNGIYFNSCSLSPNTSVPSNADGYQYAHSGQGYGIIGTYQSIGTGGLNSGRFYVQVKLKDSLQFNKCYYVEFFVSSGDIVQYGSNNVSLLFTNHTIYQDTLNDPTSMINASAQILNYNNPVITDTMHWVKVSSIYVAKGGEKYITLGNFKEDNETDLKLSNATTFQCPCTGYFVDDISVIPLDSMPLKADAGRDTTIKQGDSVFIGCLTNGITNITWYSSSGAIINTVAPGFWVKPSSSTFYVVEQTVCGFTSRDTVNVGVVLPLTFIQFTAAPTPPKVGLIQAKMDWETVNEINVSHFNIQRSINGKDFITIGKVKAENKASNEYNYDDGIGNWAVGIGKVYYRIESIDYDGKKQYSGIRNVELGIRNGVSVFPNPAKDYINISSKENIKKVKLINAIGQVVYQLNNINSSAIQISTNPLSKGLYIVQVSWLNKIENTKLVVQ